MHLFNFYVKIMVSRVFLLTIGFLSGFLSYGLISLLGVIAMEFTPSTFSGSSHAIAGIDLF
jgi:sugar phosphate permease